MFKLRYVEPFRLKVIMAMFFGTGSVGIFLGLANAAFHLTALGTINLCLGGLFGWIFFTQGQRRPGRRRPNTRKKNRPGAGDPATV